MKFKTILTIAGVAVATGVVLNYATNGAVVDAIVSVKDRVMHSTETAAEVVVENAAEATDGFAGLDEI